MEYKKQEIKKGINVHLIKTDNFKTDLMAVFLTTKLTRENVTKNAMIPMVLRKGSKNLENIEQINKHLEEMYGADFNCGVDKTGDNQVMKFYLETIDNEFLPTEEDLLSKGINTLLELTFNPKIENNAFDEEFINTEKEKLKIIIEGRKDSKAKYAYTRCQEEMYKDKPYGLFQYGYIEDIDGIDANNLYEYYKKLLSECKIDIFVSGNIDDNKVFEDIKNNENIKKLNEREPQYEQKNTPLEAKEEREIEEKADVTQGNLILGLRIDEESMKEKYVAVVYNAILGGSATSKMFQIVREKHSLAYTAASSFIRHKNSIFIRCGIEIDNYQKALDLIREQIEDMKKGNFTDEDIENGRAGIISMIKGIPDEQDTGITYYLGQELSEFKMSFEEYEKEIKAVTKDEIVEFAKKVSIDTIYFLRN